MIAESKRALRSGLVAVIGLCLAAGLTANAQMILPLPSDLDSLPAFRISGGAASAGTFSDFSELNIVENASIGALFEFSPLRRPDSAGTMRHFTIYSMIFKGSGSSSSDIRNFDPGDLLFPQSKDISALMGAHLSIYRHAGDRTTAGEDRLEISAFGDYSLQQRTIANDSLPDPGDSTLIEDLPFNVNTWHIGAKFTWTTRKSSSEQKDAIIEAGRERSIADSLLNEARMNLAKGGELPDSTDFYEAKKKQDISNLNYANAMKDSKMVRVTLGAYFINIQISKNTMDTFRRVLNDQSVKDAYRGLGLKFAFQYKAFGYEFDYRYIFPTDPEVSGLTGSSFATGISVSGQIFDAF